MVSPFYQGFVIRRIVHDQLFPVAIVVFVDTPAADDESATSVGVLYRKIHCHCSAKIGFIVFRN